MIDIYIDNIKVKALNIEGDKNALIIEHDKDKAMIVIDDVALTDLYYFVQRRCESKGLITIYNKFSRSEIKSEAIKEFSERLKSISIGLEIGDDKKFKMTAVSTIAIDKIAKEMTEVEK